jgi:glucose/arabinose dehydrogenase
MPHRSLLRAPASLAFALLLCGRVVADELPLDQLHAPPGFKIELLARVPDAREMALGPHVLYVGSRHEGKVVAVRLDDQGRAVAQHTIASGLDSPSGVAYREGSLYVAAIGRVLRFDDIDRQLDRPPRPKLVRGDLPRDGWHGWKFIAFGPDGWLYVPVGAPCNVCEPDDRHGAIFRMKPDGSELQVFARGVRNSVGFDWEPDTHALWFTDNGRDMLGDDGPPDELNRAAQAGLNFGFPYCHGDAIADPEFGSKRPCSDFTAPAQALGPHVAALGMRFYTGTQFPARYRGQVFIAEHGSWNRSTKIGYRITTVKVEGGRGVAYAPFVTGWLQGERAWGRPADVLVAPDGSLLVSDDLAGAIYRVRYDGTGAINAASSSAGTGLPNR